MRPHPGVPDGDLGELAEICEERGGRPTAWHGREENVAAFPRPRGDESAHARQVRPANVPRVAQTRPGLSSPCSLEYRCAAASSTSLSALPAVFWPPGEQPGIARRVQRGWICGVYSKQPLGVTRPWLGRRPRGGGAVDVGHEDLRVAPRALRVCAPPARCHSSARTDAGQASPRAAFQAGGAGRGTHAGFLDRPALPPFRSRRGSIDVGDERDVATTPPRNTAGAADSAQPMPSTSRVERLLRERFRRTKSSATLYQDGELAMHAGAPGMGPDLAPSAPSKSQRLLIVANRLPVHVRRGEDNEWLLQVIRTSSRRHRNSAQQPARFA